MTCTEQAIALRSFFSFFFEKKREKAVWPHRVAALVSCGRKTCHPFFEKKS
jgi:hypothetical protein